MPLDDLGDAVVGGMADGVAGSLPMPPAGPGLPPPPGAGEDRDVAGSPAEPERRATVPVVLALLLTAVVGVGAFLLVSWAGGGSGCEPGAFESARFGYCARPPSGWNSAAAEGRDTPLDRFLAPDGPGAITVTAVPLSKGQDLTRFEQFVRGYDEQAGASVGASSTLAVDGVNAISFDVRLDGPDGTVVSREVLFAREGVAWRVTLADDEVGYDSSLRRLDAMLASWRFT